MWTAPVVDSESPPVLAVLGPTASGKTGFAIGIAEKVNGEIVSCDSVQIYQKLNIGSAKPSSDELARIRHHMVDRYPPDFQIDVGLFKKDAEACIMEILSRGKIPILCGGTGMYFNALYYGLTEAPGRSDSIRKDIELRTEKLGIDKLYQELTQIDYESAVKIQPNDLRRIVRALEVYYLTGIPLSRFQTENRRLTLRWKLAAPILERAELYRRIEARIDGMICEGLVEETRSIQEEYGKDAYALGSIGYRHACRYLDGEWDLETMTSELKKDTRHYAKRQMTWFRKTPEIQWFKSDQFNDIFAEWIDFTKNPLRKG